MLLNILLYITFLLFSLGQLGRFSFFGQQVNLYLYEIALMVILLLLILKYRLGPILYYFEKYKSVFLFFAVLFMTFIVGIASFNYFANLVGFLYQLRLLAYFLFFFYLSYHLLKDPKNQSSLQKALYIFTFATIISSLVQYFFYPDLRNLFYLAWDPHWYRLFGVFFDSYVAASVYGLLFIYLFFQKQKLIQKILLAFFFIFLIMTFSRISYLAFLIAILFALIQKKHYRQLVLIALIFSIVLILIPKPFGESVNLKRSFSVQSRLLDYQTAFNLFLKNPLGGIGYNRLRYVKKEAGLIEQENWDISHSGSSFHSSFMTILVTSGLIGLLSFLFLLKAFASISGLSKTYLVFLAVFSLADNVFFHPFVLFLFLVLLVFESSKKQINPASK